MLAHMPGEAPEMASQKVELSDAELGQKANVLIADFKDALMRSREFIDAVAETLLSFDLQSREDLQIHPVEFFRRGFFYGVTYESLFDSDQNRLCITKHALDEGWLVAVDLEASRDEEVEEFTWGAIQYCKILTEGDLEIESHTPSAINKVEEFLLEFKGAY